MTDLHADRSYDDLPESDVSTVLQVPLLWGPSTLAAPVSPGAGTHRRPTGRHRSAPRTHAAASDRWVDRPLAHTARVGLVSAGLVLAARLGLGIPGGVLVANPIPEADELPAEEVNLAVAGALAEAGTSGVRGAGVTPFVLGRLAEVTGGRSIPANLALAEHNAAVGARIAVAWSALTKS